VYVQTEVLEGDAAAALLEAEPRHRPQLVVMSTHGRTGVARWIRGSVAEKVLRHGSAPVLLIRPSDDPARAGHVMREGVRVLVPLDGSALATQALPEARRLAQTPGATPHGELVLVTVIEPARLPHTSTPDAARARAREAANGYLRGVAYHLQERGLAASHAVLLADDVAGAIVDQGVVEDADVIVMSTHGRGGLGRWWYGSIADRVAHAARVPVLLFRPPAAGPPAGAGPAPGAAPPDTRTTKGDAASAPLR
jgi:nucleotide-binding universal stress UspA family protein